MSQVLRWISLLLDVGRRWTAMEMQFAGDASDQQQLLGPGRFDEMCHRGTLVIAEHLDNINLIESTPQVYRARKG